jgi:peptide deformylase
MNILLWPADALKKKCSVVDVENDTEYVEQFQAMEQAMVREGGVGLAANQVGILKRMLVAKRPGYGTQFVVNPKIIKRTGERQAFKEGCLSLPGVFVTVPRNTSIIVEYFDAQTKKLVNAEFEGQFAHILQHEIDHLDGKTMIDKLPGGQKDQIRLAMRKLRQVRR